MKPNELVRREGLWFEASRFQYGKVIVLRDHEIGHLLLFEQDFRGESERQPAIQQSA